MTHMNEDVLDRAELGSYRIASPPPKAWVEQKRALDERLVAIGWGLFFTMLGALWLAPDWLIPETAWLVGAGMILLGLNAARLVKGIKTSDFTVIVGILALGTGGLGLLGLELPLFPAFLLVVGAGILIKRLRRR